jgi:uncharacterized RDD family membrane protein YckC
MFDTIDIWTTSNPFLGGVAASICASIVVGLTLAVFRIPSGRKPGRDPGKLTRIPSQVHSSHPLDLLVLRRIFAFMIDYLVPYVWVLAVSILFVIAGGTYETFSESEIPAALGLVPSGLIVPFWMWNIGARRSRSGQSIGYQVASIAVVSQDGNSYASTSRYLFRNVAWTLLVLFSCTAWIYIELIYLLFGSRGQTLFDRIMRVGVVRV